MGNSQVFSFPITKRTEKSELPLVGGRAGREREEGLRELYARACGFYTYIQFLLYGRGKTFARGFQSGSSSKGKWDRTSSGPLLR